jgi:transcriptional regulator with XRE-family HTH domain
MDDRIDPQALKNLINNYLLLNDLSQRELAERLDLSQPKISVFLSTGELKSLDSLFKLARLKEMLPEELLAYLLGRTLINLNRDLTNERVLDYIASLDPVEQASLIGAISGHLQSRLEQMDDR